MKKWWIFLIMAAAIAGQGASVHIWGGKDAAAVSVLAEALSRQGFEVSVGTGLTDWNSKAALLVAPGCRLPEDQRGELRRFQEAGGVLVVTGPENFGVPGGADLEKKRLIADWSTLAGKPNYRLRGGSRNSMLIHTAERGERFLTMETPFFRNGSVFVELINIRGKFRESDRYLCFNALGGADSDLLSVVVTDTAGRQFTGYADLTRQPRDLAIRFADLLPVPASHHSYFDFGGKKDNTSDMLKGEQVDAIAASEIRLNPAEIKNIAIGLSRRHLWWDKGGSLRLGAVSVAPSTAAEDTGWRGGEAAEFAVPYSIVGISRLPDTVMDPMNGCVPLVKGTYRMSAAARVLFPGLADVNIPGGRCYRIPAPVRVRGREINDKTFPAFVLGRSDRRIPLLGNGNGTVAEILLPGNDTVQTPAMLRFGFAAGDYTAVPALAELVAQSLDFVLNRPRIIEIMPNHDGDHPVLEIRLENPRKNPVTGGIAAAVSGLPPAAQDITLPPGRTLVKLPLGQIPEHFNWRDITWNVTLRTDAGGDQWSDKVSLENTVEYLAGRLLALAGTHADGRFSHHYFSDVYAARALAFLGVEKDRPEWTMAARRMMDSLVSRQGPEGGFPMGYGEEKRIFWVADNGTAAMAVVEFAHRFPELRLEYLNAVRRYYDWRETFYMDEERVAKLRREFGENDPRIAPGFFGIGYNDGNFYEKQKFGETVRVERGESWVCGISLLSLPGYWHLTGDTEILGRALRDLKNYLPSQQTVNYFGAETLFQCWHYLPDKELRERTRHHIIKAFLDPVTAPLPAETVYDKGGRRTLDMLSVVYALRSIESSDRLRATLFQHLMLVGSPSLPGSVCRVGGLFRHSTHGNSIAAARYAGSLTLIWLTELGWPGATLLPH